MTKIKDLPKNPVNESNASSDMALNDQDRPSRSPQPLGNGRKMDRRKLHIEIRRLQIDAKRLEAYVQSLTMPDHELKKRIIEVRDSVNRMINEPRVDAGIYRRELPSLSPRGTGLRRSSSNYAPVPMEESSGLPGPISPSFSDVPRETDSSDARSGQK
jgi:hypothetical protein